MSYRLSCSWDSRSPATPCRSSSVCCSKRPWYLCCGSGTQCELGRDRKTSSSSLRVTKQRSFHLRATIWHKLGATILRKQYRRRNKETVDLHTSAERSFLNVNFPSRCSHASETELAETDTICRKESEKEATSRRCRSPKTQEFAEHERNERLQGKLVQRSR